MFWRIKELSNESKLSTIDTENSYLSLILFQNAFLFYWKQKVQIILQRVF